MQFIINSKKKNHNNVSFLAQILMCFFFSLPLYTVPGFGFSSLTVHFDQFRNSLLLVGSWDNQGQATICLKISGGLPTWGQWPTLLHEATLISTVKGSEKVEPAVLIGSGSWGHRRGSLFNQIHSDKSAKHPAEEP